MKRKQILNMTILIKNHYAFYIFSKLAEDKDFNIAKNTCQIPTKIDNSIDNDLSKIYNVINNTCNLKQAIQDYLNKDLQVSYIFILFIILLVYNFLSKTFYLYYKLG